MTRLLTAVAVSLLVSACGESSGPPSENPTPPPTVTDPCSAASILEEEQAYTPSQDDRFRAPKSKGPDGNPRWRVLDALWTHQQANARRDAGTLARQSPARVAGDAVDIGEIAVVPDEGEIVLPPNTYDLLNLGLRFTRNSSGGYDVRRFDASFRAGLGSSLKLTDDDSVSSTLQFGFSFYGRSETVAFVNSDGNITFEEPDKASTERNVARLLTGPPRVAPFLADLDPSTGDGRVFLNAAPDRYTVTWCNVRGFESERTTTVQTTLLPGGAIEMVYGPAITLGDAIVGLAPGRKGDFRTLDLSDPGPTAGGPAALGERFAEQPQLDVVALSRKFYASHPDNYDQLVFWTDAPLITNAFAYETTVKNEVQGIGLDTFDLAQDFGSAGQLRSLVVMDWLGKYPGDPTQKFLGENSTVSLLGQESGHRWLSFMEFRDHTGTRSDAILGRDLAHWSFFFDSEASVMEGNDIQDLGGGSFRTVGGVQRYSLLDQYAMGLVPEAAVPPFFYVENPVNMSASRTRESAPQVGVTFNGTRRDVLIQDIVAIHGPRAPRSTESAKVHRQAFVYVPGLGRSAEAAQINKVDQIRRAWEGFFLQATEGRMTAVTRLR